MNNRDISGNPPKTIGDYAPTFRLAPEHIDVIKAHVTAEVSQLRTEVAGLRADLARAIEALGQHQKVAKY